MSVPVGTWDLVTNLNKSVLNITNVDAQGNLTGTIQPDESETYNITGTWNALTNELNFSYSFSVTIRFFHEFLSLSFQGYAFQAGDGLFTANPGPVSPAVWNMLAGTYQVHPFSTVRGYGWVARSPI